MAQEKTWKTKDVIYAKDVMMFANPTKKTIELIVCGKNGYCPIGNFDAKCEVWEKLPEDLKFLGRNLEQELYNKSIFNFTKYKYTVKDFDISYLIKKIRFTELYLTTQNFNKENFEHFVSYLQNGRPSHLKPNFFANRQRPFSLNTHAIDWDVQVLTIDMFFDFLNTLHIGSEHSLKYKATKNYMMKNNRFLFYKNRIPRIQNRNKFFTYYELLVYKEFLNMNYAIALKKMFDYQEKLEGKIQTNKVKKVQKQKAKEAKENSKETYEF